MGSRVFGERVIGLKRRGSRGKSGAPGGLGSGSVGLSGGGSLASKKAAEGLERDAPRQGLGVSEAKRHGVCIVILWMRCSPQRSAVYNKIWHKI